MDSLIASRQGAKAPSYYFRCFFNIYPPMADKNCGIPTSRDEIFIVGKWFDGVGEEVIILGGDVSRKSVDIKEMA